MNGVWHSEQVISRSGIAVSPRERIEDIPSLCSSERWRGVSFNHKVCGTKALFLKHYAKSWRPDWFTASEFTPANRCIQTFIRIAVAGSLHRDHVLLRRGHSKLRFIVQFTRHECCSALRSFAQTVRSVGRGKLCPKSLFLNVFSVSLCLCV